MSTLTLELIDRASPKNIQNNDVSYFDSFGVEHIKKKFKNLLVVLCPLLCIIKT